MGVTLTQEFIDGAIYTQNKYGVPASVTLAQIMLESGGSYSGGLSGLAYKYKNLFGIKKGSWTGDTVTLTTTDWSSEKGYYSNPQEFRVYSSYAESIEDHAKVLLQPIYTNKTKNAKTLDEYIDAFAPIYASPSYADSIKKIIKENNLTQYDNGNYSVDGSTSGATHTGVKDIGKNILSYIVQFSAIVFLLVVAVIFFINAFGLTGGGSK